MGLFRVGWFIVAQHQGEIASSDVGAKCGVGNFVAGKLFGEKLIVGKVLVKRVDHVIAVAPDVGFDAVAFVAVGFCVTNGIEPEGR